MKTIRTRSAWARALFVAITLTSGALIASSASAQMPRNPRDAARSEIQWMQRMIAHHTEAIGMAELLLAKADAEQLVHAAELVPFAENIIATQEEEIAKMTAWLSDWYGVTYVPRSTPMGTMGSRMMDMLAASTGAQFEAFWLRMMVPHHAMAVVQSQALLRYATHEELKALAADIIATQTEEVRQMVAWLNEWKYIGYWGRMGGGMTGGMR